MFTLNKQRKAMDTNLSFDKILANGYYEYIV